jgi:mRNA interferase MazF
VIFRGAIYGIKTISGTQGHEQQGNRFGVIIQSDRFATSTITVALTSSSAGPAIYRPEIEIHSVKTRILTDQIFSVTSNRLGEFVGSLDSDERTDLDQALLLKLGLV